MATSSQHVVTAANGSETAQIPAPESAKEKLRSRPHLPWMVFGTDGKGVDENSNPPPALSVGNTPEVEDMTAEQRARMRFAVKGNVVCK